MSGLGKVQIYQRPSGSFFKTLIDENSPSVWQLSLSRKFLVAKLTSVAVFDVERGFERLRMTAKRPDGAVAMKSVHMVTEDSFIVVSNSTGCRLNNLSLARIDPEKLTFNVIWRIFVDFALIHIDERNIAVCGKDPNLVLESEFKVYSVAEGHLEYSVSIATESEEESARGIALTFPLGILLTAKTRETTDPDGFMTFNDFGHLIYLVDVIHGVALRKFGLDCGRYLLGIGGSNVGHGLSRIKIFIDPPIGTMMLAAHGSLVNSTSIAVFDLTRLLREARNEGDIAPDRVIRTGGTANADSIVANQHQIIHHSIDKDDNDLLVECEFWGKL